MHVHVIHLPPSLPPSFHTFQSHECSVRSMEWSHNAMWMATTDDRGVVKYWQSNMNNVHTFQAHNDPIRGCRWGTKEPGPVMLSSGVIMCDTDQVKCTLHYVRACVCDMELCVFGMRGHVCVFHGCFNVRVQVRNNCFVMERDHRRGFSISLRDLYTATHSFCIT